VVAEPAAALAAGLAIALYAHTLGGTWIYDDLFHARDDPRLSDFHLWRFYLTEGYAPDGVDHLWRPLVSLSYAVQWKLTGDRAWPFHLVNVLLHAGASALVAEFARRLTRSITAALIAGLLFAAHPLHVEVVSYIVGRAESACAVGTLGALVLALRPLSIGRALAIFACFLMAIFSKEQGLLLPLMLAALWPIRSRLLERKESDPAPAKLLLLLIVFSLAAYIVYREHILPWYWETNLLEYGTQPMIRSGAADRALIPVALLGRAMALLVLPLKLSPEYGISVITPHQSLRDPYLYIGLASVLVVFVGAWLALRRRAATILFLLLSAAMTYFMVSNVKLIGVVFAERLLYLPSAFVLILAAMAMARLPLRAATAITALLLIGWGIRTTTYAGRWNDRLTLYEKSVEEFPKAARMRILLAGELIRRGQLDRAREVAERGAELAPDYWKIWIVCAQVALAQGRFDDAQALLRRAWNLDPYIPVVDEVQSALLNARAATPPTTRP